jgi:membrane fusion protein (multidrug efflux system)
MAPEENKKKRGWRKLIILIILCALIAVGAGAVWWYLEYTRTHISTDDAYLDGRVHVVAPRISGKVVGIRVEENQHVARGDLLVEIDPTDYIVRAADADSALRVEKAKIPELNTRVAVARKKFQERKYQAESAALDLNLQKTVLKQVEADIRRAEASVEAQAAKLKQAERDIRRAEDLYRREVISKEKYQNTQTAYDVAAAQLAVAKEQLLQTRASRDTQLARVKQAEADLMKEEAALGTQEEMIRQAEAAIPPQQALIRQKEAALKERQLNRSYTRIFSPVQGFVTRKTVEVGNQVQVGQPLMAVVPLDQENIWITANYKETDLKRVKPGQRVKIKVDTYPDKVFYGRVNSIMAGTGSVFSLFPPENATGNFVKVVQRIPVRIFLEKGEDPGHLLRIGMSVVPTILVE